MNRIIVLILLIIGVSSVSNADVYVVTNSSHNVYAISNQNDIVVPSGDTETIMKGQNIENLPITGNPQLYNFSNGGFTVNTAAVTAKQASDTQAADAQQAIEAAKISAIEKLTDAISKVDVNDVLTNSEMQALLPS